MKKEGRLAIVLKLVYQKDMVESCHLLEVCSHHIPPTIFAAVFLSCMNVKLHCMGERISDIFNKHN